MKSFVRVCRDFPSQPRDDALREVDAFLETILLPEQVETYLQVVPIASDHGSNDRHLKVSPLPLPHPLTLCLSLLQLVARAAAGETAPVRRQT